MESSQSTAAKAESNLADYILSFCGSSEESLAYIKTHLGRLVRTLEITPRGTEDDRILEMGAYMQITAALRTKLGYGEVRGCYLGPLGTVDSKSIVSKTGEAFSCFIDLFNAETDRYPYPDGYFATVVCCELIEHLALDPMHLFAEVNRITRPGGHFVLSTPNICSLRSVAAVITGYHPALFPSYVKPLPGADTNRHEREYTPREIGIMLTAAGFEIEKIETGPYEIDPEPKYEWAIELLKQRGEFTDLRGDTIHAVGRKIGPVQDRYPAWLYV